MTGKLWQILLKSYISRKPQACAHSIDNPHCQLHPHCRITAFSLQGTKLLSHSPAMELLGFLCVQKEPVSPAHEGLRVLQCQYHVTQLGWAALTPGLEFRLLHISCAACGIFPQCFISAFKLPQWSLKTLPRTQNSLGLHV